MQFNKNTLIESNDVTVTIEGISDNQFDLVYLDLPWFTSAFNNKVRLDEDSYYELKSYLAEQHNCEFADISLDNVKDERFKRRGKKEKESLEEYSMFITKIFENAKRILNLTGILCFKSPADPYIDYKLMLDQIFSNTYIMQVTLENKKFSHRNINNAKMNHETLYFYSKSDKYTINKIYDSFDSYKEEFNLEDDKSRYKLSSLLSPLGRFIYEWKGITPDGSKGRWLYKKEKLDELFIDNRIVIKDTKKVYLKCYQNEHPREKSTVWKETYTQVFGVKGIRRVSMATCHFVDLINLTTQSNDWIISPYDVDGKLPVIAQNMERNWVALNPKLYEVDNYCELLDKNTYDVSEKFDVNTSNLNRPYSKLIKNVEDIISLKSRLVLLESSILEIKNKIGVEGETVDTVIEKIQIRIEELIEKTDIENYIPFVKGWIEPHWGKLESESKFFLPTAEFLYEKYKELDKFDLTTAMIVYSKALEKEIYEKMFKGYIKKLLADNINVRNVFSYDFGDYETMKFTKAVNKFTKGYKNKEEEWHFELGTMAHILNIILCEDSETSEYLGAGRIYRSFKDYLEECFEVSFFDIKFNMELDILVKLRNDSAHPQIVDSKRIDEGKELIKRKIVELLKHYVNV